MKLRVRGAARVVERVTDFVSRRRGRLATGGVSVLAVLLSFHVIFGHNGMLAYQQKRAEYRKLQQEVERLQRENERTSRRIRELKSDPKAIEREAREQLRYARPGEIVYTLPEPFVPPSANATAQRFGGK